MKTKTYLSAIICCFIATPVFAQKNEFKFGKIDKSDLTAAICPVDPGAVAYIIGDYGVSSFAYTQNKGFQTIYQRHFRMKILKKSAIHIATIEIPLYVSNPEKGIETISELKGNTYNIESGKIIVSKLDKKEIYNEKINRDWTNKKFIMPDVKEGSVIEVSYTITSDFYDLRPWKFQYNIPVVYSQYETRIPEYFKYKLFKYGFDSIRKLSLVEPSTVDITWTNRKEFSMVSNEVSQTYYYKTYVTTYTGENIKAFQAGPHMSSSKDYVSSLEFVLVSMHIPNSKERNYESTWESITKNLLGYDDFGAIVKDKDATKGILKLLEKQADPLIDKATAIFEHIRNNFKWNGNDSVFASKSIGKIIEDKTGNSADINLLLINTLKNAGIKAEPVVLSTRDNGKLSMTNPVLHKLNYVIALVKIDDKQYLLDATDKQAPFGFIPEKCLNGKGRIINDEKPEDIDLTARHNYQRTISAIIKVKLNGELSGNWNEVADGYDAYDLRRNVSASKGIDNYIADEHKKHSGLTIQQYKLENLDSLDKNVIITYDILLTGFTESKDNLLLIRPLLMEQMKENPFTMEDRKYPVDYAYPYALTYTAKFDIPEGYRLESLPKSQSTALPDKSITFMFNTDNQGNKIEVTRSFTIRKSIFGPDEYKALKELYDQVVKKESEVIVLKKL